MQKVGGGHCWILSRSEDCWRKVQVDVSISRSLAAFETAISADWWQSKSSGPLRECKGVRSK